MSLAGELFHNTALVIDPNGTLVGAYYKSHPIQFFSDGVPGHDFPAFTTPVGHLGLAICYDFDFASTALKLVHNGADVLLVPTFDAMEWGDLQHTQHARMAQARAAETDRWVIRATSSGVSQVITPDGNNAAVIPTQSDGVIVTVAAPRTTVTPYVAWTHWLVIACLWLSLGWVMWMLIAAIGDWVRRQNKAGLPVG